MASKDLLMLEVHLILETILKESNILSYICMDLTKLSFTHSSQSDNFAKISKQGRLLVTRDILLQLKSFKIVQRKGVALVYRMFSCIIQVENWDIKENFTYTYKLFI